MENTVIRNYRGDHSMREMADRYNVSAVTWNRWEKGLAYPRGLRMQKLAQDIGLSIEEIFFDPHITSKGNEV